jgi:GT2 family glycosyltransferase
MPPATVVVPTRHRPAYLEVALRSLAPQAAAAGAELLVVDDGPSDATREIAARHGARYLAHAAARGLNAARNTALRESDGALLAYVDDDVEARPGWLAALLAAHAAAPPDVGALTGPILPRFEGHRFRTCGREGPPITALDLGPADRDAPHAWGANMAVRRAWVERVGPFDERLGLYGDEQEWQARLHAAGGRIRYVAAAALDHRRAGDDARLRALARAAHARGRAARREDIAKGVAPPLAGELRVLAGCLAHGARFACPNGPVLSAHAAGRVREALAPVPPPARAGVDDFLSGRSGTVGGRRDALRALADVALDLEALPRRARLDRAARARPLPRRVLVLGVERPGRLMAAARRELARSRHDVELRIAPMGTGGKFEHLNALLAGVDLAAVDWLLVVDDDVTLPRGFLDRFLLCCEEAGLRLAQPAHRRRSHAAWPVTRRRRGQAVRATRFVEIGPVTAFAAETFAALLPFPDLSMGWGLDVHWGAVAGEHGWRVGVVDAAPVRHTAPAAGAYGHEAPSAQARTFLAGRPYVTRGEAGWSRPVR